MGDVDIISNDPQAATPRPDKEERFARMMRAWWRDERPGWTDPEWWDAPVRDEIRSLLWLPAGARLAAALDSLTRAQACPDPHAGEAPPGDPAPGHVPGWPCACMVVLAAAWEACFAWSAAGAATSLVDAAGAEPVTFDLASGGLRVTDPAREELALALRASPASMGNRIAAARGLVEHPRLVGLVATATLSAWAARLVVLELAELTAEQARAVVDDVVTRVLERQGRGQRAWTSAEVGQAAKRARLRLFPATAREERARAFAQRRVQVHPSGNGMATLLADIDETDAHRIHRRISAIAKGLADPADPRTRDQVRADVLVDLLLGGPEADQFRNCDPPCDSEAPDSPDGHDTHARRATSTPMPRTEVKVVVSLATLLGLAEDPAVLPGVGPITADVARTLAADGRWTAWITDAAGAVAATGSRGYVPSEPLARLVCAREPQCRMPGCRQPAERCDLDHTVPWPAGLTEAANLGPLCRRHHVMKTHAGWELLPELPLAPPAADQPWTATPSPETTAQDQPCAPSPAPGWRWRTPAGFTVRDDASEWTELAG